MHEPGTVRRVPVRALALLGVTVIALVVQAARHRAAGPTPPAWVADPGLVLLAVAVIAVLAIDIALVVRRRRHRAQAGLE